MAAAIADAFWHKRREALISGEETFDKWREDVCFKERRTCKLSEGKVMVSESTSST